MKKTIITKKAFGEMKQKLVSPDWVELTVSHPDSESWGKKQGTKEFVRDFDKRKLTAVVVEKEESFLVLGVKLDPPYIGTKDDRKKKRYLEAKKSGIVKRSWLNLVDFFDR